MTKLSKIFSITKGNEHHILTVMGVKIKFRFCSVDKTIKKYLYAINECEKYDYLIGSKNPNVDKENQIWTCWFQGDQPENMPEIVQICIKSIKKYYPNTIIITDENLKDYITMPDFITEKYEKGLISKTFYSDIIRICLLEKYGGTWIDATCLLTDKIPNFILKQDFYFFSDKKHTKVSSWFIHAKENNYLLKATKALIFEYWKVEENLIHYFLLHKFLIVAKNNNQKCKTIWDNILLGIHNNVPFLMAFEVMQKPFNKELFDYLCKTIFIHKLSYKVRSNEMFDPWVFKTEKDRENFIKNLKENGF